MISDARIRELADYSARWLCEGAQLEEARNVIGDAIRAACAEQIEQDATQVFIARQLAAEPDADDKGLDVWLQHAEDAIRAQDRQAAKGGE